MPSLVSTGRRICCTAGCPSAAIAPERTSRPSRCFHDGSSESGLIDLLQAKYREKMKIPCTGCGYCLPCPNGVDIPRNLELYSDALVHEDLATARFVYQRFFAESERAHACNECGACVEQCPQRIDVPRWLATMRQVLDG